MKTILGIETTTGTASIGTYQSNGNYTEITRPCQRALARELPEIIEQVLTQARIKAHDLTALAVSIGPGSFTGLRIGLAAAKGISLAADIPIVPVSTPDTLAHQVPINTIPLYVLQQARKTQAYSTPYTMQKNAWVRSGETTIATAEMLQVIAQENAIVTGNGCFLLENNTTTLSATIHPTVFSGKLIAQRGLLLLESGTFIPNPELEPEYVNPPDAKKAKRT